MDNDLLHEQAYLKHTEALLQRNLDEISQALDLEQVKLREARVELQENQPAFSDDRDKQTETAQYLSSLQTQMAVYQTYTDRLRKLNMLIASPYFGRIDFAEEDQKTESYYIGRASLRDPVTYQMYVCDWRTPLASMFYRAVPGSASYVAPGGEITGRLSLKRQYEILNGELEYYFDTDFHIKDGILKKMLSEKASSQLKAIVESLQDAQDRLIRQKSKALLIQGSAGSGKTSLAMHRAAFLMYQDFQDSLTSQEILIVSPNHLFSHYVSNVLPELGEENISSLTFDDIFSATLDWVTDVPDIGLIQDGLLTEIERETFLLAQDIHGFKSSAAFALLLQRMADYFQRHLLQFPDVYYHQEYIASRQELKEEMLRERSVLPLAKRLELMRVRLSEKINEKKRSRFPALEEFVATYPDHQLEIVPFARLLSMKRGKYLNRLLDSLPVLDIAGIYRSIWKKDLFYRLAEGLSLPENVEEIRLSCEKDMAEGKPAPFGPGDAPGMTWLRLLLEGSLDHPQIRQVIVDEAQDYGPLHYMLLRKWFPRANFTILGDVQQCLVQTKGLDHFQSIGQALGEEESPTAILRTSFRSTWEISSFCRRFLDDPDLMEPFDRHGQPVEILGAETRPEAVDLLLDTVRRFRAEDIGSIAVICKNAQQAAELYGEIKGRSALRLVNESTGAELNRNLIIPLYLVKGLEFDGVILWEVSEENYHWPEQRRFLYLASSRALHKLSLIHTTELSSLVGHDN